MENDYTGAEIAEQQENRLKTVILIISVIAFLAGFAAALAVALKQISTAMARVNKETEYPPIDGEDLTSTDYLHKPLEEDEQA